MIAKLFKLGLLPIALYFAGYVALTWPAIERFSTHTFGDSGDGFQHVWNLWWVRTALLERGVHFFHTDMLHHPGGVTLLAHTLAWTNGLIAIPLASFLSPIQTYDVIVVLAFVLTGWTTFLLAWHVSRSFMGSLFAGAAMTFSSYHFAHAQGHIDLISFQWVPLFLLAWIRLLERPAIGRAVVAAAILLAVVGTNYYYALYAVVAGALLLPVYLIRCRAAWREAGARGLLALGVFVALALGSTGFIFFKLLRALRTEPFADVHPPLEWCLDPGSLIVPGGHWRFAELTQGFWRLLPGNVHETSVYVGWSVILAAAFGLWACVRGRGRGAGVWAAVGAIFLALALGPALKIFGRQYDTPWMPYGFAERFIPGFDISGMPIRMTSMVQLAAAVLAAIGLGELGRTLLRPAAARVLFAGLFIVEILPAPIPTTPPNVPDYVTALASFPPGAVFGLDEIDYSLALYHQTLIKKPMNGGLVSRRPHSCVERYDRMKALLAEGRIPEFFAASQARYVVRPTASEPPRGLEVAFAGERYAVLVAADDPLAREAVSRPEGARAAPAGAPVPAPPTATAAATETEDWDPHARIRLGAGWYPAESEPGPNRFRWTGPRAELEILPERPASKIVVRLLSAPRPTSVRLTVNGVAIPPQRQEKGAEAVLTFVLPPDATGRATLACSLESDAFTPRSLDGSPDDRALGLRVADIRTE